MAAPQNPGYLDPNLVPVDLPQSDLAAAATQALNPPVTVATAPDGEEMIADPDMAAAPAELGPDANDRMYGRANMLLDQRGPGARPKEPEAIVQESEASEAPLLSPEARVAHAEAGAAAIEQQYIADRMKRGVEQKKNAAELAAMTESQKTFERLGKERDRTLATARLVRDNMNQISNEIAREAANPASEGLFSGLDTGGSILRGIGLLFISAGAGMRARGGDMSGAEQAIQTMRELSMQEVRQQQRRIALKQGAHDAQGMILERHMANLQDAELAAKATEADLMRIAMIKAKQYAVDAAPVIGAAESKLLLARMEQESIVAAGDLNRLYGEKLRRQIDTKYTIPRRALQMAAAQSPFAVPAAQAAPTPAPADPLEAHLMGLGNTAAPLDPSVAAATGAVPPPAPSAQASVRAPAASAAPAPAAPAAPAAQPKGGDWVSLLQAGRVDEAVLAMPAQQREIFKRERDARMKDKRFEGQRNAALSSVIQDTLDRELVNRPESQLEQEQSLTTNNRKYRLNVRGEEAQKVRSQVLAADRLVAKYQRLLQIGQKYGGSFDAVTPKDRGEIGALANQIASLSSQAFEMGVIQKWDNELWAKVSGEKLAEWITDPRTDFAAAARTAYQEALRDRKMRLQTYGRPVNDAPAAPRERPVK